METNMKDFLVVMENQRKFLSVADGRTLKSKANELARKFNMKVLEIKSVPLRERKAEKPRGFLQVDKCRVTKMTCPFSNRIMSQCKSFTEKEN